MKYLLVLLLIHGVLGHYRFGESYLANSLLCKPWVCVNEHLKLDDPPTPARYATAIKTQLPSEWHSVVDDVVNDCFDGEKPRQYTSTCPGQAMLHCVVDNLIENCPESSLRTDDACAPVSSLAGFKYMFSQSRYENLERYLPTERRPQWFLKNYFSTKCCDLPQIFDISVLNKCGFNSMMHYYGHEPRSRDFKKGVYPSNAAVVMVESMTPTPTIPLPKPTPEAVRVVEVAEVDDLLSCCDLSQFVPPQGRVDCNFVTKWDSQKRLSIEDREPNLGAFVTTTTTTTPLPPTKHHDVKVVPLSCESESCIFTQLNITSDGKINKDAFSKLLDNWTKKYPEWSSAKARVDTMCLNRPLPEYRNECEINAVLRCVFDVLSENCPEHKKTVKDPCKHVHDMKDDTICRISSSKYRPRNRRLFCDFPSFVDHTALAACNVSSIFKIESVPEVIYRKPTFKKWFSKPSCKETTTSSLCLMSKMGVLNKYKFMDYFKLKDRIRQFTASHEEWAALQEVYMSAFTSMPFYRDHCASQRKLLNVLDTMIMTCPVTKRQNTPKCNKMFEDMIKNVTDKPKTKMDRILNEMFPKHIISTTEKTEEIINEETKKLDKKMHPILGYGMFGKNKVPPVEIIPIKPQVIKETRRPMIVMPVYSRTTPENRLAFLDFPTPIPEFRGLEKNSQKIPDNFILNAPKPTDWQKILLNRWPQYGPFHQDATLRGAIPVPASNIMPFNGNELDTEFAKPE